MALSTMASSLQGMSLGTRSLETSSGELKALRWPRISISMSNSEVILLAKAMDKDMYPMIPKVIPKYCTYTEVDAKSDNAFPLAMLA